MSFGIDGLYADTREALSVKEKVQQAMKREFLMAAVDFKTTDVDMLLNIREYHNLPDANRATFNQAVYKALKPGEPMWLGILFSCFIIFC